jgi:hypothetical protein
MPTVHLYLPPELIRRLDQAARSLCLSRTDFARAVLAAAARELDSDAAPIDGQECPLKREHETSGLAPPERLP